jgi:hypothetical protein
MECCHSKEYPGLQHNPPLYKVIDEDKTLHIMCESCKNEIQEIQDCVILGIVKEDKS